MKKSIIWNLLFTTMFFVSCGNDDSPLIEEEEEYEWVASHTIAEFLDDFGGSEVTVDTIAVIGVVISSDEAKNIENELFIKDETGALVVALEGEDLFQTFPIGTEVLLKCVGLKADGDSKKITLADGSAIQFSGLDGEVILTGNEKTVTPSFVSFSNLSDNELNRYVRLTGFQFDEGDVGKTYVQDNSDTLWELTNSDGDVLKLSISKEASFADEQISSKAGLVNGLYMLEAGEPTLRINSLEDLEFSYERRAPFEKKEFQWGDNTLPYQIMFPRDYDETKSYPLVMFLHGAGERGNNNTSQMANGPETFGSYESRTDYPAIVVFPQCPSDIMWSRRNKYTNDEDVLIFEFPVEAEPNYAMEMLIELVGELMTEEAVDQNRIYITGLSMGGIGVYEFMYYAPDIAAAGISMAGGHDPELLSSYGNGISFRLYHGGNDNVVPARYSQGMYDKMVELGIDAEYTEADGRGHEWNYVLNDPEYLEWMFGQSKD